MERDQPPPDAVAKERKDEDRVARARLQHQADGGVKPDLQMDVGGRFEKAATPRSGEICGMTSHLRPCPAYNLESGMGFCTA